MTAEMYSPLGAHSTDAATGQGFLWGRFSTCQVASMRKNSQSPRTWQVGNLPHGAGDVVLPVPSPPAPLPGGEGRVGARVVRVAAAFLVVCIVCARAHAQETPAAERGRLETGATVDEQ